MTKRYNFDGKSILVTGGTGSFGKHFIKTILRDFKPKRVVIYSRDELKQFEMQSELPQAEHKCLRYFIGDVRDVQRLRTAFRGINVVVHAAALKQVPAAEYNPFECIKTNVHGAENVVTAAIEAGVERVLALSTDKAASPINLYGASKLASDKIFVAANNLSGADGPTFSVVRYGNVVGSRGSIVPLFRRLVAEGAESLPITDDRMTRFWITLDQGVEFVISSLDMMRGGEIFVPKIASMKIVDLAAAIAPDMPIKIIGIRPGEKLHETMITQDDARDTVELEDRYVIEPSQLFKEDWSSHSTNRVPEDFSYSSENNTEWLSTAQVLEMIDG